jgi:MraZ protein
VKSPAFSGSYPYRVDEKGRTKLPASFLEALGDRFVATRGLDGCLWLLPAERWEALTSQLRAEGFGSRGGRRLQRFFIGGAAPCALDPQGRLSIPPVLREHAAINGEIVVAGVGPWVEVWSRDRWEGETSGIDALELDELLRGAGLDRDN